MMRHIRLFTLSLLTCATLASAELLVNTRLHPTEAIASGSTFQLDLRDHFQHYTEPGPVATFALRMPVQAGWKWINLNDGSLLDVSQDTPDDEYFMTYKLLEGDPYTNVYDSYTEDLEWIDTSVQFQLFPEEVPITVANFMTYAADGAYENTIVHRNQPGLGILQAGGFYLHPNEDFYFSYIDTLPMIPFELNRLNTAGTLAMARQSAPDTASSQFYVNLQDNSANFGQAYTVFGELIDLENALPLIGQMGDAWIYNLGEFFGQTFKTVPMFTPYYNDKDSYLRFPSITVSEGNPDGVAYAWEWVDADGVDGVSDEEAASRALFNVQLNGSALTVERTGSTGTATIKVTGTSSSGSSEFEIDLAAYNPDALKKFPASSVYGDGWIVNSWYGWLVADSYPYIQHLNHGYQYVSDAGTTRTMYLYDYRLKGWLYTTDSLYPYLYVYSRGSWVWYQLGSGNGANLDRWFYDYTLADWFTDGQ